MIPNSIPTVKLVGFNYDLIPWPNEVDSVQSILDLIRCQMIVKPDTIRESYIKMLIHTDIFFMNQQSIGNIVDFSVSTTKESTMLVRVVNKNFSEEIVEYTLRPTLDEIIDDLIVGAKTRINGFIDNIFDAYTKKTITID